MSIYIKETGNIHSNTLFMFIHGGGVSGWMWDKQVDYYSEYHCLIPDLPAQGLSQCCSPFTIKRSAHLLLDILKEKGKSKRIVVVGFSLGAQVLVQMLSMNPNLIDYAMINSALTRPMPYSASMIKPLIHLSFPLIKIKTFSRLQAQTLYIGKEQFPLYYKESIEMKKETLIQVLVENMTFCLPPQFSEANSNILVTVGEKERTIMKKSAKDLIASNKQCNGLIIRNIGHGFSFTNPTMFNQLIDDWLANKSPLNQQYILR
ncbi:alpha/beta fold hydrolase [Metabacillus malikii]|uniref:Pimeloyl-ACP methyl ester carboxylesterase n=1 Tax=Metabacillus malikii TaxID=1504265 RepID=A0ABT9ZCR6_9BACI|nr:alpha/beta hydrolase [Metabacillus malikii]MDQ0230053.1 pimeloyl-ACP methyl ester carboxylesterase [Metabacillus malikii]